VVGGGGAAEFRIGMELNMFADKIPGLSQYTIHKFATALEIFPKTIADNSGINGVELLLELHVPAHTALEILRLSVLADRK
jgi:T-complex protein 1 subunit theta